MIPFHQDPLSQNFLSTLSSGLHSETETPVTHSQLKAAKSDPNRFEIAPSESRMEVIPCISGSCRILAPCEELPTELIQDIIRFYVPQQVFLPLKHGKDDPRLHITHICSLWRNIAFSMSTLWDLAFYRGYIPVGSVELAKAWLGRLSTPGFSITIHRRSEYVPPHTQSLPRNTVQPEFVFEELIAPNSRGLRSLTLKLDAPQWDLIRSLPFDNLVTLNLEPFFSGRPSQFGELLSAPSLRSVCLHTNFIPYGTFTLLPELPWVQLSEVSIHGRQPLDSVVSVLSQCSLLESCTLYTISPADPCTLAILLPHLKSLTFCLGSSTLNYLLPSFIFPSLSSLTFHAYPFVNEEATMIHTNFFHSVANTLRHFEISHHSINFLIDNNIVSVLSQVSHLILPRGHLHSELVLSNISSGAILPNLEHLEFELPSLDRAQSIADMLSARGRHAPLHSTGIPYLKKVIIYSFDTSWEVQVKSQLQALRSQGMEILSLKSRGFSPYIFSISQPRH